MVVVEVSRLWRLECCPHTCRLSLLGHRPPSQQQEEGQPPVVSPLLLCVELEGEAAMATWALGLASCMYDDHHGLALGSLPGRLITGMVYHHHHHHHHGHSLAACMQVSGGQEGEQGGARGSSRAAAGGGLVVAVPAVAVLSAAAARSQRQARLLPGRDGRREGRRSGWTGRLAG